MRAIDNLHSITSRRIKNRLRQRNLVIAEIIYHIRASQKRIAEEVCRELTILWSEVEMQAPSPGIESRTEA